jgi:two-component SAPR family response regulator
MLLMHPNYTVPTALLVDAIWDTSPPAGARNQLQGCVSRLRKHLAGAGGEVIHTDSAGYRAAVQPDELDLLEFRRLVAEARDVATAGQIHRAIGNYRAALALWRGAQAGYGERLMIHHVSDGAGCCRRCGRVAPCDYAQHGRRLADHYRRWLTPAPAVPVRSYACRGRR